MIDVGNKAFKLNNNPPIAPRNTTRTMKLSHEKKTNKLARNCAKTGKIKIT